MKKDDHNNNHSLNSQNSQVVFFDAQCPLCCNFIQFCIKHDRDQKLAYLSLHSDEAKEFLSARFSELKREQPLSTVILLENACFYVKSSAVLKIFKCFNFPWNLLYQLRFLGIFLGDLFYDLVAKNRKTLSIFCRQE